MNKDEKVVKAEVMCHEILDEILEDYDPFWIMLRLEAFKESLLKE